MKKLLIPLYTFLCLYIPFYAHAGFETEKLGIIEGGVAPTFDTYIQGGDQGGDITYTLPTASTNGFLKNAAGILSWDGPSYGEDTDIAVTFGRWKMGYNGDPLWVDYPVLSHYDTFNATDYALAQSPGGWTYLNCAAGSNIDFCVGGVIPIARINASGFTIRGNPILFGALGSEDIEIQRVGVQNLGIFSDYGDVDIDITGSLTITGTLGAGKLNITPTDTQPFLSGATTTTMGAVKHSYTVTNSDWLGIYNADTALYYGISCQLPSPAGTSTLGGYYKGLGVGGSVAGTTDPIFGILNSGQSGQGLGNVAFTVLANNKITTFYNTLDDGSGNAIISGTLGAGAITGTSFIGVKRSIYLKPFVEAQTVTTGDGKIYFVVPVELNGMNLISVGAHVYTASTSGTPTIQIRNATDNVDMLSTAITIDINETDSSTATTAAVIDTSKDDVATADVIRIDVDVAGTGTKGLDIRLGFNNP